jgi:hypothetical protein
MQTGLFDHLDGPNEPPIDFCDHRMDDDNKPRLSRQCRLILERLRQGQATGKELCAIAQKYTGRISDLRKSGYQIDKIHQNHRTGLTIYALFVRGQMVAGPGVSA